MRIGRLSRMGLLAVALTAIAPETQAFPAIPKESAKALGVTKGKKFDSGLVFVNGKFLPPPYQVERWGTGLRINGQRVSGQVIDWSEFLKTQSGVKVTRTEASAEEPAAEPTAALPTEEGTDELSSTLDDLFDDDPRPRKKARAAPAPVRRAAPKPKATVTYAMDGEFVMNEASKALLGKINAARRDIDQGLRLGGFVFFGDGYARITGDARTAQELLDQMPELLQRCDSAKALLAQARANGLVYMNGALAEDLYRNRIDYRTLQERRAVVRKNRDLKRLLK